jgi:hypothetical protein
MFLEFMLDIIKFTIEKIIASKPKKQAETIIKNDSVNKQIIR